MGIGESGLLKIFADNRAVVQDNIENIVIVITLLLNMMVMRVLVILKSIVPVTEIVSVKKVYFYFLVFSFSSVS